MSGYSFWLFTSHKLSSHRSLMSCLLWRGPPFRGHVWELWNLTEEVASDWGAHLLVPRLPQRLRLSVAKCLACFFLDCFSSPLPHSQELLFPSLLTVLPNIFFHCSQPYRLLRLWIILSLQFHCYLQGIYRLWPCPLESLLCQPL